jgi:hypothetical protein
MLLAFLARSACRDVVTKNRAWGGTAVMTFGSAAAGGEGERGKTCCQVDRRHCTCLTAYVRWSDSSVQRAACNGRMGGTASGCLLQLHLHCSEVCSQYIHQAACLMDLYDDLIHLLCGLSYLPVCHKALAPADGSRSTGSSSNSMWCMLGCLQHQGICRRFYAFDI